MEKLRAEATLMMMMHSLCTGATLSVLEVCSTPAASMHS
jgi:hypothetical protein